jgi:hypothetical protein
LPGVAGVASWWNDLAEEDGLHFELIELHRLADERWLTTQRLIGTFRLTGIDFDVAWGSIVTARDGRIVRADGYDTPKLAKRAGDSRTRAFVSRAGKQGRSAYAFG